MQIQAIGDLRVGTTSTTGRELPESGIIIDATRAELFDLTGSLIFSEVVLHKKDEWEANQATLETQRVALIKAQAQADALFKMTGEMDKEIKALQAIAAKAYHLSCYTASIRWSHRERNTKLWLTGLEEKLVAFQPLAAPYRLADRAQNEEDPDCEGCGKCATTADIEGVDLCPECYKSLVAETPKKDNLRPNWKKRGGGRRVGDKA